MRRAFLVPLLIAVIWGACYTGPSVRSFAPAQSPRGIWADLRVDRGKARIQGELLEVQDSALLVLRDGPRPRVTIVPLRAIRAGFFPKLGTLRGAGRMAPKERERLRLVSRFPAGLTPELRARLLSAYGQTEADGLTPP